MKTSLRMLTACAFLAALLFYYGCSAAHVWKGNGTADTDRENRSVVFEAYGVRFLNPFDKRSVRSGRTLKAAEDHSNIYLETETGRLIALLDRNRRQQRNAEGEASVMDAGGSESGGSGKVYNPMPVRGGTQIVFAYRAEESGVNDLYIMDADGGGLKLLLDGEKYGDARLIDTLGSTVYAAGFDHSLIVIDTVTRETKKFAVNGRVDAVSEDGVHVLYRRVEDGYVLPELWMYDLRANKSKEIGPQPERYFLAERR